MPCIGFSVSILCIGFGGFDPSRPSVGFAVLIFLLVGFAGSAQVVEIAASGVTGSTPGSITGAVNPLTDVRGKLASFPVYVTKSTSSETSPLLVCIDTSVSGITWEDSRSSIAWEGESSDGSPETPIPLCDRTAPVRTTRPLDRKLYMLEQNGGFPSDLE